MSRLIVALDTADQAEAASLAGRLGPVCGLFKLGLEFFLANGPRGVAALDPARVFLDLKLHDIPRTVERACAALAGLAPAMLTVHASGGSSMIAAARAGLERASGRRPVLLAVTVLTSLDASDLVAVGVAGGARQHALRLAALALASGADGVVCSGHEAAALRARLGPEAVLVVPGIRPAGAAAGDQARVMTPRAAIEAGADRLVVGRPILDAADPVAAARAIGDEIDGAA